MGSFNIVLPTAATRNGAGTRSRTRRPLRVVTYLAPNLFWFYQFVCRYLGEKLALPMQLGVGSDYARLSEEVDIAFLCSLPYVEHTAGAGERRIEPLVAPVLHGERYGDKPIYFSDVVVRHDSPLRCFADLRGRSWAYNEPLSQSGYGIVRHHLVRQGETHGYFGSIVEAGFHERSVQMVSSGEVDASAIDSHVLALLMRDNPTLANGLRVIDTLGPSPIQPIVVGSNLPKSLKSEIKRVLLAMSDDPRAQPALDAALVKRFEPVADSSYDDIRRMRTIAETAHFLTIR